MQRQSVFKNIFPTLLLFIIVAIASTAASFLVKQEAETSCFNRLAETVKQEALNLEGKFRNDEQRMENIVSMLADHAKLTADNYRKYIGSIKTGNLVTSYSVLMPDGTMIFEEGAELSFESYPVYEETSDGLAFLSDRFDAADGTQYVAFIEPIVKDGETMGWLYGYINLTTLPDKLTFVAFNGEAQIYIVDGDTGDFLVDTWHDTLGNINDPSLGKRESKDGLSSEEMHDYVKSGREGYSVFVSKTTGENFYTYFYPIGLYNISFQITVAENVAFANAMYIQTVIYTLCNVLIVALVLYLFFLGVYIRRQFKERKRETDCSGAVNEIQQMLFNAYREPDVINLALKKTGDFSASETVRFLIIGPDKIDTDYCFPESEKTAISHSAFIEQGQEFFNNDDNNEVCIMIDEKDTEEMNEFKTLFNTDKPIKNIIGSKVYNPSTGYVGILYAINSKKPDECAAILDMLAAAFQMAVRSIGTYKSLKQTGEYDFLTKLKNRNAYQKEASSYGAHNGNFACAYIDANGLHDLNNAYGHAAGDAMLRTIGEYIGELFGTEESYRIGGDEFVTFVDGRSCEQVQNELQTLRDMLAEKDYYISIGMAFRESNQKLQTMLKLAEDRMYEDKKKFYSESGDKRKARQRNEELEEILMQKNDQDSFIAAISAEFLGVYVVNLDTDVTRVINCPSYFEKSLKANDYNFSDSLKAYAEEFVTKESMEAFAELLDYEKLEKKLAAKHNVELFYRKNDSKQIIRARVLTANDYSESFKNTLWIFEYAFDENSPQIAVQA